MADDHPSQSELEPREPTVEDLRDLCRELNRVGARYVVIGGFAVRAAGYNRRTMDVDLLVATDRENESRVFGALATLPDNAVRELQPGELQQYNIIRVADEILVDLMGSAGGIGYAEAAKDIAVREVDSVPIPFASQPTWSFSATGLRNGANNRLLSDLRGSSGQLSTILAE
jgi:hypothetical protein